MYCQVCNLQIHKPLKISKSAFLDRVKSVEMIRTRERDVLTWYPVNQDEWDAWDAMHLAVRHGDFDYLTSLLADYTFHRWFVLSVPNPLYDYFVSTDLVVIKRHIIFRLACLQLLDMSDTALAEQLNPLVYDEVRIMADGMAAEWEQLEYVLCEDSYLDRKQELCCRYTGKPLPDFMLTRYEMYDWERSHSFSYRCNVSYFTEADWNWIVEKKVRLNYASGWKKKPDYMTAKAWDYLKRNESHKWISINRVEALKNDSHLQNMCNEDNLRRAEAEEIPWMQWKSLFQRQPHKGFIFGLYGNTKPKRYGNIYLIRAGNTMRYKIGFTETTIEKRVGALQTGNCEKLSIEACGKGTRKYEKRLHKRFEHYQQHGEWFEFSDDMIDDVKQAVCSGEDLI